MIDRCRGAFPVRMMCQHLGVSPSGYYEWRGRPPSQRARANQHLLRRIRALHEGSEGVLGRRRIQEDLAEEGLPAGVNRVGRLMKNAGLFGILQRRRWRKKTSAPRPSSVLNHLDRNFEASRSNTKWATDITYVRTGEDWLYLCVVIDLYARLVNECSPGSTACTAGSSDGALAKAGSIASGPAFGPWNAVHER